jgi:hypothetical protein
MNPWQFECRARRAGDSQRQPDYPLLNLTRRGHERSGGAEIS